VNPDPPSNPSAVPAPPPSSREVEDAFGPRRKALAALLRSPALSRGDVEAAIAELTEVAVEVLRVERASVWRFDSDKSRIECVDLFERTSRRHTRGQVIERAAAPAYFRALDAERSIAAEDAKLDPRTREFDADYLRLHGIGAMLDAPIFAGNALTGVVCLEHVGHRRPWRLWEELAAGTLADFVAMVLATAERIATDRELREYREHLEQVVEERTATLRETERGMRKAFEASPVPMLVLRASDERVLYANRRAADAFAIDADSGTLSDDFWVRPQDRARLLDAVTRAQHVQGFEAPLTTKSAVIFAELAVERITLDGDDAFLLGVHDITRQHRAETQLRERNQALLKLFAAAPVPFVLSSIRDGLVRLCNPRAADLFETTVDAMIGRPATDFYVDPFERQSFLDIAMRKGKVDGFTVELKTSSGRAFWGVLSAQAIELDGELLFMVGVSDVTAQKRHEEELRELAMRDALTGLYNRRHFLDVADRELARADRYGQAVSVAMLDVDRFKRINDTYGHAAGDRVLRRLAERTKGELRKIDVVARIGGEEFAILFPETAVRAAERVVERLQLALREETFETDEGLQRFTVSIGLVERRPKEPFSAVLQRADEAMYDAKEQGRDRLVVRA
jgi:diguanylate cyclase (GGDEF)-like protein/PAS domain S-box-containing protein